ncbi:hypothetical protein F4775DRAFT_563337 [Biscogniauxia sp. FL1348]|nr:hypothetical protein F4775DRAFT_563337 [Biscogniauxia sp. FL1348]
MDASLGYGYEWNPNLTPDENRKQAWAEIRDQFYEYLKSIQIHPGWVLYTTICYIANNFRRPTFLRGNWPDDVREQLIQTTKDSLWRVTQLKLILTDLYERPINSKWPVRGMQEQHRFYTLGRSSDILIEYLVDADYGLPLKKPYLVRQYKWFPGKLRSRIMYAGTPESTDSLHAVCLELRDTYRFHKPLSTVGGTVCIHVGAAEFWTLTQLKKFATLWILIEQNCLKLFRKDRGSEYSTRPLGTHSRIAKYLQLMRNNQGYAHDQDEIVNLEWFRNRVYSEKRMDEFRKYVPIVFEEDDLKGEVIREIWQYRSINALREGLGDSKQIDDPENQGDMAVYFGMHGWKVTGDRPYDWNPETRDQSISVRLMHSTMNPRHIEAWASIVTSMARLARADLNEYADALRYLWKGPGLFWGRIAQLSGDLGSTVYLTLRFHPYGMDAEGLAGYLEYLDGDKGLWMQPWVVQGYGSEFIPREEDEPDND